MAQSLTETCFVIAFVLDKIHMENIKGQIHKGQNRITGEMQNYIRGLTPKL